MTEEYLFQSDLEDDKVLAALERIDTAVDQLVKSAQVKFGQLQKSANTAFSSGPAQTASGTAPAPAAAGEISTGRARALREERLQREQIARTIDRSRRAEISAAREARLARTAQLRQERQQRQEIRSVIDRAARQERQSVAQQISAERNLARIREQSARAGGDVQAKRIALLTNGYHLLIQAVGNAARATARFFSDLLQSSAAAALNIESVGVSFAAVFESADVGAAVLDRVREAGLRLGEDITAMTRRILPLVGSVEEAIRIAELAAGLGRLDPLQGTEGALISINEALTGNLRSLRERFEIPVDDIKDAQSELGTVNGLIEGLGETLRARGLDFETLEETADVTFSRTRQRLAFLKEEFGQPILDELNEQFLDFNEFMKENETNIRLVVDALGNLVAKAIELVGTNINEFFDGISFEGLFDAIHNLNEIILLIKGVAELGFVGPNADEDKEKVDAIVEGFFDLKTALESIIRILAVVNGLVAKSAVIWEELGNIIRAVANNDQAALTESATRAEEAFANEIRRGQEALDAASQAADASRESLEQRREEVEKNTEAELELAAAITAKNLADRNLEEAEANLEDKQTEVDQDIDKAQQDFEDDVADAQLDAERKRLDIEEEFAQKRVDLARKNAQEIADILRDHAQSVADAARDLARKESEIIRDHNQKLQDIEQERADNRVEIEEDFQQRLQEIRRKFDFDAEEAVRANDAVALLKIRRRMNFELEEAKKTRDQKLQEDEQAQNEAFEKEKQNIQRLLEEARIANAERLQDLQINLQRRLEEQQIGYQRELEEFQIAEERKQEEVTKSLERQLADLEKNLERRVEELQASLDAEVKAVQEAEAAKVKAYAEATARLAALAFQRAKALAAAALAGKESVEGTGELEGTTPGGNETEQVNKGDEKADKGTTDDPPNKGDEKADKSGGDSSATGDEDPPRPPPGNPGLGQAGGRPLVSPPTTTTTTTTTNITNNDLALGLTDPTQLTPEAVRAMTNIATQVIQEALS